jgi:hypothetical protein
MDSDEQTLVQLWDLVDALDETLEQFAEKNVMHALLLLKNAQTQLEEAANMDAKSLLEVEKVLSEVNPSPSD